MNKTYFIPINFKNLDEKPKIYQVDDLMEDLTIKKMDTHMQRQNEEIQIFPIKGSISLMNFLNHVTKGGGNGK